MGKIYKLNFKMIEKETLNNAILIKARKSRHERFSQTVINYIYKLYLPASRHRDPSKNINFGDIVVVVRTESV